MKQQNPISKNKPEMPSTPPRRKPEWLRFRAPVGEQNKAVTDMMRNLNLHTICEEAMCPNRGECFARKTAAFLILGDVCTRNCRFCAVKTGTPLPPDPDEPAHLARACERLELHHVVITSVTRDDLPDGGADHFSQVVLAIRDLMGQHAPMIELLIPDLEGHWDDLARIIAVKPEIINHNVETVPHLYRTVRPQADYDRSLALLKQVKKMDPGCTTKSGLMLGLGETEEEVLEVLQDLRKSGCDMLTIGQYLAPSRQHLPVVSYIEPAVFDAYGKKARSMGFESVASGPHVRSSYLADESYRAIKDRQK